MKYTDLIWDFNGTILDDIDVCVDIESDMLERRGKPRFKSVDEYYKVFCFPVIEYYKKMGYDFTAESYDDVADEWVREYVARSRTCGLRPGVEKMLGAGRKAGIRQIILSASEIKMLTGQVKALGIDGYFDDILALDDPKAHGKLRLAEEWFSRAKPERALLIGDTAHDAEAAGLLGCDCVLVCGGHASRETLEAAGVPVYDDIEKLYAELYGNE